MENCVTLNEELTLPSGCHLVKININKRLFDRLYNDSSSVHKISTNENNSDNLDSDSIRLNEPCVVSRENDDENDDLIMDILPETTRFTTTVSMSSIDAFGIDLENTVQDDDLIEDDLDVNYSPKLEHSSKQVVQTTQQLAMYVQKNSRLKLVLLSVDMSKDKYEIDNLIRIVSINYKFQTRKEEIRHDLFIKLEKKGRRI